MFVVESARRGPIDNPETNIDALDLERSVVVAQQQQSPISAMNSASSSAIFPSIVELNVGGVFYTTALSTLTRDGESHLAQMFTGRARQPVLRDSKGKFFIDRDGILFRYILDFLRNQRLVLPENFHERDRLRQEADFFKLSDLLTSIDSHSPATPSLNCREKKSEPGSVSDDVITSLVPKMDMLSPTSILQQPLRAPGYITVGYRGTFAFGRDGLADVKFRKLSRILICGRVALCREVFNETLNESRDPDRGATDRYSSRFFLKHTFLEQAFDALQDAGFSCVASCASGTAFSAADMKPGMDSEENRWNHYNEFIFVRG